MNPRLCSRRSRILVVALLAIGLGSVAAHARPMPAVDLPAMTQASDLIVVGHVQHLRIRGSSDRASLRFSVAVDRVLKAVNAMSSHPVVVQIPAVAETQTDVMPSQYGIFFLRRGRDGVYEPTDPNYPALVAVTAGSAPGPASDDALTSVVGELGRVLMTPPDAGDPHQHLQARAFEAFQAVPYKAARRALGAALKSQHSSGRLWALACLFFMGDSEELDALRARHLEAVGDALLDPAPDLRRAVSMLVYAMQGRVRSATAVPTLTAFLESRSVAVRRAAASVLGDIKTPQVIGPLAEVALNDPDAEVRYFAVLGLSDATGISDAPSLARFEENEAALLRHWRGWARRELR